MIYGSKYLKNVILFLTSKVIMILRSKRMNHPWPQIIIIIINLMFLQDVMSLKYCITEWTKKYTQNTHTHIDINSKAKHLQKDVEHNA